MKLSMPCNWDVELIEATKDLPVYDFYGAIATTPIGHGRPALILPDVDEDFVAEFIKKVHSTNRKFSNGSLNFRSLQYILQGCIAQYLRALSMLWAWEVKPSIL